MSLLLYFFLFISRLLVCIIWDIVVLDIIFVYSGGLVCLMIVFGYFHLDLSCYIDFLVMFDLLFVVEIVYHVTGYRCGSHLN